MDEEIYLNLNEVDLVGYEPIKSFSRVAGYVNAAEKGDIFPAVPVKQIGKKLYSLIWVGENGYGLGGHKRSISHFIANKLLRCKEIKKGLTVPKGSQISIKEISLY